MYLISARRISLAVAISCLILGVGISSHAQTYKLLYQFKPGADGSQPYSSLILDKQGNMYGTTSTDGAYASGTVYRVTPSGKETVLYSFTGLGGDGANPYTPLTGDSAGNLYGTTTYGGNYGGVCGSTGCGTVFKLAPTGKETVLHRFTGVNGDGYSPYQGVIRDAAGNLYGTTALGGSGLGIVFKISPTGKETIVHDFNFSNGDGYFPAGGSLIRDSAGDLYGVTEVGGSGGAGTVYKIDKTGNETILASFDFGSAGYEPYGSLLLDAEGNLYGTTLFGGTFNEGTAFKVDTSGNETALYNFSGMDGDGVSPNGGLVQDSAGNLYGTTGGGGKDFFGTVFKIDPSGTETILRSFSSTDGRTPESGLVRDSQGNLYGTTQYGGTYGGGVLFKLTP
jgi:uncharacterized repeat protein (TIGR03803 family)